MKFGNNFNEKGSLHVAIENGNEEIVRLLCSNINTNLNSKYIFTCSFKYNLKDYFLFIKFKIDFENEVIIMFLIEF